MNAKIIQTALGYAKTEHTLSQVIRNTSRFNTSAISLWSLDTLYDPRTSSCFECWAQDCRTFQKQIKILWVTSKRACRSRTAWNIMWRWMIKLFSGLLKMTLSGKTVTHILKLRNEIYQYLSEKFTECADIWQWFWCASTLLHDTFCKLTFLMPHSKAVKIILFILKTN
jgi:hypothetical protein